MELAQVVNALEPLTLHLLDVVFKVEGFQNGFVTGFMSRIFLLEVVEDVAYAQTVSGNLVSIGRADALACSAYLVLAFL